MAIKLGRNVRNRIVLNMTKYHSFSPNTSKVIKKTLVGGAQLIGLIHKVLTRLHTYS